MFDDLTDLYQQLILDHSKSPRNFRVLPDANRTAQGTNPICGDNYTLYAKMDGDVVKEISFQGSGCAISTASASLMTESLKGKTRAEAERMFDRFHRLLTADETPPDLGKLAVFSGVRAFPVRVKCATLAWHALRAALQGEEQAVSTE